MRRAMMIAAAACAVLVVGRAAPALAGYGAFAVNPTTSKYGLTWDKRTLREAEDQAMKDCGGSGCKIMFRTRGGQCTAIAKAQDSDKIGAAFRGSRDAASLASVEDCQKQTKGQCKVAITQCNH